MSIRAVVKRKEKFRIGKGFSRIELKEKGLSFKEALKKGIPIDPRRSTKYEENIKSLETYLSRDLKPKVPTSSSETAETKAHPEKKKQKAKVAAAKATVDLAKVRGIGPKLSQKLIKAGFKDANQLAASNPESLAKTIGVSEKRASTLIENARSLLKA